ncbi:hypothetical protein M9Y10_014543 [Tritrichomonas musculus]|uniref:Protein kinase domain-containing protein n=1 Tax=Tritrichomonas musculus TaxID=1915356 RepID=A0ABR2L0R9_9EUKA
MLERFEELINHINKSNFNMTKPQFIPLVKRIRFHPIFNLSEIKDEILQRLQKASFIVIDLNISTKSFVICFNETLILIDQTKSDILSKIFGSNIKEHKIFFLKDSWKDFSKLFELQINENTYDPLFEYEIENFVREFKITSSNNLHNTWDIIKSCLAGYFIKKSYWKNNEDRIYSFLTKNDSFYPTEEKSFYRKEFISLRPLGFGSFANVQLFYHIETESLYAVKIQNTSDSLSNFDVLNKREIENYRKFQYPLLPRFYGTIEEYGQKSLVIEYIHGKTLDKKIKNCSMKQKFLIFVEILFTFQYLHQNNFVYRDLKPDNIIVDENDSVVLIDFNKMRDDCIDKSPNFSNDIWNSFAAPEIHNNSRPSDKSDIYSIGKMIHYIFSDDMKIYPRISNLYQKCTESDSMKRPTINELINLFKQKSHEIKNETLDDSKNESYYYIEQFIDRFERIKALSTSSHFNLKISDFIANSADGKLDVNKYIDYLSNSNNSKDQYKLGLLYCSGSFVPQDFNKSLHYLTLSADQNNSEAQLMLGIIYCYNQYFSHDINKSLHYLTLSANQNNSRAQYELGIIYYEGIYIQKDIYKSIHYLTLSANENNSDAQFKLGFIYFYNEIISRDVNKSIYYLTLSSNQNNSKAQFFLGSIYYYLKNIEKSIYYLTLSSNQNNPDSHLFLGIIYYNDIYVSRDINKAILYFKLAANQNNSEAQLFLGRIYYDNKYIKQDISKAIYYLTLSSNQKNSKAYIILGYIYYKGEFVFQDINKAIYYFTLSANQNNSEAQLFLGLIYYNNKYIKQDINKAIHYLTLSSNQNNQKAQLMLSVIYKEDRGIRPNINESIRYLTLSADQNNAENQYKLGCIYYDGNNIPPNINKSIYYLTLSANQKNAKAQCKLGIIYYENKFVPQDIKKSIYYFELSSKQNYITAQSFLGIIYYDNQFVPRDINKSIHYFTLAAAQNDVSSQFFLGLIYFEGIYVPRDINKSIHYFTLSSNQDEADSQFFLGLIYYEGIYVPRDINKSIHFFTLSSNHHSPFSQFFLGHIYYENKYIKQDINKSIHYLTLSSNQNFSNAQFLLGLIYYESKYFPRDVNKSIYYLTLSANQNDSNAQYNLSVIYFFDKSARNIRQAIKLLKYSAENKNRRAQLFLAHLYFEGQYLEVDITKAISLYKEVSCFDNQYAKNNLGVIYKNSDFNKKYIWAKTFFNEAIKLKRDKLAMFNLSNMLLDEEENSSNISNEYQQHQNIIKLLIESSFMNFIPSQILLLFLLIKKHGLLNLNIIQDEFKKHGKESNIFATNIFKQYQKYSFFFIEKEFQKIFKTIRKAEFVYMYDRIISYEEIKQIHKNKKHGNNSIIKDVDINFYEGFGLLP